VVAVPGKAQAFAVYIYNIYIYKVGISLDSLWGKEMGYDKI
jgi:hypothetical protein